MWVAFGNGRTVTIRDGALEIGWIRDIEDEDIAGPIIWRFKMALRGENNKEDRATILELERKLAAYENAMPEEPSAEGLTETVYRIRFADYADKLARRCARQAVELGAARKDEKDGWDAFYRLRKSVGELKYPGMDGVIKLADAALKPERS